MTAGWPNTLPLWPVGLRVALVFGKLPRATRNFGNKAAPAAGELVELVEDSDNLGRSVTPAKGVGHNLDRRQSTAKAFSFTGINRNLANVMRYREPLLSNLFER